MSRFFWKQFPILYVLPFILASLQIQPLSALGEALRWLVLLFGCGVAANAGFCRAGLPGKVLTTVDVVIVSFLAIAFISITWSIEPMLTAQRTVSIALMYGCSFWALWAYVDQFSEQYLIRKVLQMLGIIFILNLTLGLILPNAWLAGRFRGLFSNPNNIGLILSLALPLTIAQWLNSQQRLFAVLMGVFAANLVACGSRSPLLGTAVACLVLLISMFVKRSRYAMTVAVVLLFGLGVLTQTDFFVEHLLREDSLTTASNRTYFWDLAQTYISERPAWGHGFGTDSHIHGHYGVFLKDLGLRGHGVMSSYYGFAVQLGWPLTYAFFGLLWGFTLIQSIQNWRSYEVIALTSALMSGLIVCVFEPAIYSAGNIFSFLFWLILMLSIRHVCYQRWGLQQST